MPIETKRHALRERVPGVTKWRPLVTIRLPPGNDPENSRTETSEDPKHRHLTEIGG